MNLEKRHYKEKVIHRLVRDDGVELRIGTDILHEQAKFYEKLYENRDDEIEDIWPESLISGQTRRLTEDQKNGLEGPLTFEELTNTLKSMANRKSPGTDGFTVEFFKFFWNDIGKLILKSLNEAYDDGELSIVQRQGIITCIPKENCDRSILKNWRPITLLNVIYKIASGSIANRLKKVIPSLISEEQRGFIKGRYIGENIRLIYDVMQVITEEKMKGLLLIVDFEKAFDSISRKFIGKCLQYFGFGSSIISWIKTLIMSAGACVVQNGHKSHFFPVRRGTRQGDPLSGYIYISYVQKYLIYWFTVMMK